MANTDTQIYIPIVFAVQSAEGAPSKKPRASDGPVSAHSAALGKRKKKG